MKKVIFSAMLLTAIAYAGCGSSKHDDTADSSAVDTTAAVTTPTDSVTMDSTQQTENPTAASGTPGDNKKGNTNP